MNQHRSDDLLARLARLGLPHLRGLRLLVIGDPSGALGAFARFQGALRVDEAADVERLGGQPGPFDVVVWLDAPADAVVSGSALDGLVDGLSETGMVVFHTALARPPGGGEHAVGRWTRKALEAALQRFAVKLVPGPPAEAGAGSALTRLVFHVAARRPLACLLMLPPGYGKTSVARRLFASGSESPPIIAADALIHRIALGKTEVAARLQEVVRKDFSPARIDETVVRIMEAGVVGEWVEAVVSTAGGADFVLDGFVPFTWQSALKAEFASRGFLPVTLQWERLQPARMEQSQLEGEVGRFRTAGSAAPDPGELPFTAAPEVLGNIDSMTDDANGITLCGWAVWADGNRPAKFEVRLGRQVLQVLEASVQERPDVMEHLGLPHARIGFRLSVKIDADVRVRLAGISVRVEDGSGRLSGPLHWSG